MRKIIPLILIQSSKYKKTIFVETSLGVQVTLSSIKFKLQEKSLTLKEHLSSKIFNRKREVYSGSKLENEVYEFQRVDGYSLNE